MTENQTDITFFRKFSFFDAKNPAYLARGYNVTIGRT